MHDDLLQVEMPNGSRIWLDAAYARRMVREGRAKMVSVIGGRWPTKRGMSVADTWDRRLGFTPGAGGYSVR